MAAAIAVGSKFVIRRGDRHLFNPTNFAIALLLGIGAPVWVSPGQYGHGAFMVLATVCLGSIVVHRAARSDVTFAFLAAWAAVLFGRSLWLGEPLSIPLHRVENGLLLQFAFNMISDPRTTPDSRAGRIVFAVLVALGGAIVQFALFRTNGLIWSLAFTTLLVPLLNRLLPGMRHVWGSTTGRKDPTMNSHPLPFPAASAAPIAPAVAAVPWRSPFRRAGLASPMVAAALLLAAPQVHAFCGFYVAGGNAKIFNESSQVVLVRDGDRTTLTMVSDFKGDLRRFAVVIPVPTVIQKEQVAIGDPAVIEHLDRYSAPRLVEYWDPSPCAMAMLEERAADAAGMMQAMPSALKSAGKRKDVTVEARYTVGEYDIVILSATTGRGLESWLVDNGYRIPSGAAPVFTGYLKQGMRFFVAKVNLEEHARMGVTRLRPIRVRYESSKFGLPLRLGMANARGPQDMIVYAISRKGRTEVVNYRTLKLPTDVEIPEYVAGVFPDFYRALFQEQMQRNGGRAVFTEYAWDMSWCDPCPSEPLSAEELKSLGVTWGPGGGAGSPVFLTRLHVRYDRAHFPEDLVLQETPDTQNWQARYIMNHPWRGEEICPVLPEYWSRVLERREREADNLAELTGWDPAEIRGRMGMGPAVTTPKRLGLLDRMRRGLGLRSGG